MKNLTEMTIDDLSKLERQHLEELSIASQARNDLIKAAATVKGFELNPQKKNLSGELNALVLSLTNILPPASMKQIGELINPVNGKVKFTPQLFQQIGVIINTEKANKDKQINKLDGKLKTLQGELEFRAQTAVKFQARDLEIDAKKPLSRRLRFWVWLGNFLGKFIKNKANVLLVKIQDNISKLLPTIEIPAPVDESSMVEISEDKSSVVDPNPDHDSDSTTSSVEPSENASKAVQLSNLKNIKMPKNKLAGPLKQKSEDSESSSSEDSKAEKDKKSAEKTSTIVETKADSEKSLSEKGSQQDSELSEASETPVGMIPVSTPKKGIHVKNILPKVRDAWVKTKAKRADKKSKATVDNSTSTKSTGADLDHWEDTGIVVTNANKKGAGFFKKSPKTSAETSEKKDVDTSASASDEASKASK